MEELTTLYIDKESHKFSAAHYTIFSATERERLHGHNYVVVVELSAKMLLGRLQRVQESPRRTL